MASDPSTSKSDVSLVHAAIENVLRRLESGHLSATERAELARALTALRERLASLDSRGSVVERLRQRLGGEVELAVDLSDPVQQQGSPSDELVERLAAHGPKESRYRVDVEIARGGMGAIWKIFDPDLRRSLAMKVVLQPEAGDGSKERARIARFLEEAQITGQLDHPGVVPVHELGLDSDGRLFFTMRLVRGRDLDAIYDLARRGDENWSTTRVLGVILKVCEAMTYAHSKGVIHRDLKPSNVMVGRFGEVYVMDWGLAKVIGRRDNHDLRIRPDPASSIELIGVRSQARQSDPATPLITMDGTVLGTPAYMSPEQARGEIEAIDARADVYALGAMLYQLLAGVAPFQDVDAKAEARQLWMRIIAEAPTPLVELNSRASPELISIVEKAMARDRESRYPNMGALADDLRAHLEDRVVKAHATGLGIFLRKWVRRNRLAATVGAAAVVAFLVMFVLVLFQRNEARANLIRAWESSDEARDAAKQKVVFATGWSISEVKRELPDVESLDGASMEALSSMGQILAKLAGNLPTLELDLEALQRRGKARPHPLDAQWESLDGHVQQHLAGQTFSGESFSAHAMLVEHVAALLQEHEELRRKLLAEREYDFTWDGNARSYHPVIQGVVRNLQSLCVPDPSGYTIVGIARRNGEFPRDLPDERHAATIWTEHSVGMGGRSFSVKPSDLSVDALPSGATFEFDADEPKEVVINGQLIGKTPLTLSLADLYEHVVVDLLPNTVSGSAMHSFDYQGRGASGGNGECRFVSPLGGPHTVLFRFRIRSAGHAQMVQLAIRVQVGTQHFWSSPRMTVKTDRLQPADLKFRLLFEP